MPTPVLARAQILQLSAQVANYISMMRARFAPAARPIARHQRDIMASFFSDDLLDRTRLALLTGERVPNPDFYPTLVAMGFTNLPDQSGMAAITFSDIVVAHVLTTRRLVR